MFDVTIFQALHRRDTSAPDFGQALGALGRLPLADRIVYLGLLESALVAQSVSVRVGAVRAIGGANGRPAFRALLRALSDESSEVRQAAVESFAECAARQPGRWIHMLFHPNPDVRASAIERLPESQRGQVLFLLPDPKLAPRILEWFTSEHRPRLAAPALTLLFGLCRAGHLRGQAAAQLLDDVFPSQVLEHGNFGPRRAADLCQTLVSAARCAPDHFGGDALDPIFAIVLGAEPELQKRLTGRLKEQLLHAGIEFRLRAVASLLVCSSRGAEVEVDADPQALALEFACHLLPRQFGSELIPVDIRRRAARELLTLSASPPLQEQEALEAWIQRLAPDALGAIDLSIVAGLLRLAQPGQSADIIARALGEPRLIEAFLADPITSAPLLSRRCLPERERRLLLARLCAADPTRFGVLVALSAWVLPVDQLTLAVDLEPDRAVEVLSAIFTLERTGKVSFGPRKVRALVQAFVDLLGRTPQSSTSAFMHAWLEGPAPGSSALGVRVFGALVEPLTAEAFVQLAGELAPEPLASLLEQLPHCAGISFGKELALAHALCESPCEAARVWAEARLAGSVPKPLQTPPPSGRVRVLSEHECQELVDASESELGECCRALLGERTLGLAAALAARSSASPNALVVAALLGACDEVTEVAAQIERYSSESLDFLEDFELLSVAAWAHTPDLGLLGAAWVWRWEPQATCVGEIGLGGKGGLPQLLDWSRNLGFAQLRASVWFAVARCLEIWGARNKNQFWHAVGDGKLLVRAALDELDTDLGDAAANLLLALYRNQVPSLVAALSEIRERLPDVALTVAKKLDLLLDTRGLKFRTLGVRQHQRSVRDAELRAVRSSRDLAELSQACCAESPLLVQEAVLRLLELPEGEAVLADLLARSHEVRLPGLIAESIPLWSTSDALESVRALLTRSTTPNELKFRVALAFCERGERELLASAFAAAVDPDDEHWFSTKDYERLCGLTPRESVWLALAGSPHPYAYRPAALGLSAAESLVPEVERRSGLRRFLEAGTDRDARLRSDVAEWLARHGDDLGFPLCMARAITERRFDLIASVKDPMLYLAATRGVLMAGEVLDREHAMVDLLEKVPVDVRDQAFQEILLDSHNEFAAERAVRALDDRQARLGKLHELASLFAWGFRTGLILTGRHHQPHMTTDGAYGYVRRNDPRVYVTPLPLLRGDPNGKDVVEGLILHELGHHRWHSGPDNDRVWAAAEKVKMHGLLNLVADEHLERNLRAIQPEWGDKLKRLAAYAFQHAAKDIAVTQLLRVLGANAFGVLSECSLELGHDSDRVRVDSGALLRSLSDLGHSFARFMRALRMGLGSRHEDPRVDQALALFKPSFRKLEMPALLEIAYRLRDIFGDDAVLLDSFGGAETVDEGSRAATASKGTLTDRDIQPEVERILDPRKLKSGKGRGTGGAAPPKLSINVTGVPHFDKLTNVERLIVDPGAHREVAREVARPARKLRAFFEELGIQRKPVRFRTSGTRLDRPRLGRLVLLNDPRVLTARQPRFDTDLFVGLLVDCSGSMQAADNIIKARRFAVLVAEAAKGLAGIDVRIFGFTGTVLYDAGDARRCAATSLEANGGNNDAGALLAVAEIAKQSRRRAKLLVMVSDGLPTECSAQALTDLVKHLEQREHMVLAQVAVRPLEEQCFSHYVRLDEGDSVSVVRRFGETIARLVSKALR